VPERRHFAIAFVRPGVLGFRVMKVLFVYTDINVRGGAESFQFGTAMVSAMLKRHGHDTRLHYMFGKYRIEPLNATVAEYDPDVIAFSAVSPQYPYVRMTLRDMTPSRAFTILGGQHATLKPDCLEENPRLKAVCIGEGEYPMLDLVEALDAGRPVDGIQNLWVKRDDGSIARNPTRPFVENLDTLPFPDRDLFDTQSIIDSDFHTALFMFSRGCPYTCTFCANHALRKTQCGTYVRFRSVESCLSEIRDVVNRFQVEALYFNDDCFTCRKSFVDSFCEAYKNEFSLPFDINARPETLNDDICRQLKEAGCRRISIGIENGSETFRREVLERKMSNDRIAEAFDACRRAGIRTKSFNIVGFPYETPEIFEETVRLNTRINPDSVIIGIFEPYPGTKLADVCEKEGFINRARADALFVGRTDTVLDMPGFTRKQILKAFRTFAYRVYKPHSLRRALILRAYYSRYGQFLLALVDPFKHLLRRLTMGV
jgi:anaerobic magnesium-protoporphyrin IX monomethyl ester cyclase